MTAFPTLVPSSRTFTPGEYPATAFSGFSGAQNRVRHSNVLLAAQLRLTFLGLTQAQMLDIWNHYNGRRGQFRSFDLPAEVASYGSITDYVPGNYLWRYAGPSSVEDLPCGGHNVSLTLETVPPTTASVVGADLFLRLRLSAGVAAGGEYAPGVIETIALSLSAGAALVQLDGVFATLALSLATGVAIGDSSADGTTTEGIGFSIATNGAYSAGVQGISKAITLGIVAGVAEDGAGPTAQYEVFLSSGTWDWTAAGSPSTVDVLLVGGGGGGGSRSGGGGGGAGGLRVVTGASVSGNVTVTVGSGGAGASNAALGQGSDGAASSFGAESVAGGGGGGEANITNTAGTAGRLGGSGGGGGRNDAATSNGGAASPTGQGNAGGIGGGGVAFGGGGGGGAGGAGGNRAAASNGLGGLGGLGIALESLGWTPESGPATVCIGGQGGRTNVFGSSGGQGGGGAAPTDQNGTSGGANTGGGGGGGSSTGGGTGSGGSGGSGLVIVRWIA